MKLLAIVLAAAYLCAPTDRPAGAYHEEMVFDPDYSSREFPEKFDEWLDGMAPYMPSSGDESEIDSEIDSEIETGIETEIEDEPEVKLEDLPAYFSAMPPNTVVRIRGTMGGRRIIEALRYY